MVIQQPMQIQVCYRCLWGQRTVSAAYASPITRHATTIAVCGCCAPAYSQVQAMQGQVLQPAMVQQVQAQPMMVQAQPQVIQAQPMVVHQQAQPQMSQAQPQMVQAQPQMFQAQPRLIPVQAVQ